MKLLSHVRLSATSWPVAYQSPPSMGFSRQNTGVGCHFLLQEIFPTQVLNLSLQHYRQMLYSLSHQGSPFLLKREQQNKCPFYHKVSFQVINTHTHTEEVSTTAESVKALSSPPLIGTPKLQLFIEQLSMKKTGTYQKRSSITKDIKKEP